ncbi:uncharacterized protein EV154DRAFT_556447 [Mucor mucedo]|uniref:uncharacterized protein n=1 Tax=Mucor mucedo TaxID=29922 RepID=UPI00221F55C7|nr:uncharacterized protein EV154DRAFT_556447 [Mucor mucedo]KAI7872609.1 hypothetical protein EV154DRAFT_556447 [Mucor mucedo]
MCLECFGLTLPKADDTVPMMKNFQQLEILETARFSKFAHATKQHGRCFGLTLPKADDTVPMMEDFQQLEILETGSLMCLECFGLTSPKADDTVPMMKNFQQLEILETGSKSPNLVPYYGFAATFNPKTVYSMNRTLLGLCCAHFDNFIIWQTNFVYHKLDADIFYNFVLNRVMGIILKIYFIVLDPQNSRCGVVFWIVLL